MILVLGGSGLLGGALREALARLGRPVRAPGRGELDLGDLGTVERAVEAMAPQAIVNAAAFTDVAAAEEPGNRDAALLLNRDVPQAIARAASSLGVPLVHVSTDYVFDGASDRPYTETDPTSPVQLYGTSKLQGEERVLVEHPTALVVRTSTLYGPTARSRPTYVDAILRQAYRERVLSVVELPVSSPTYAPDLADMIVDLLRAGASGIVHAANDGHCSRLELARAIVAEAQGATAVEVVPRAPTDTGLKRPAFSALDVSRLESITGRRPRPWRAALRDYLRNRAEIPRS